MVYGTYYFIVSRLYKLIHNIVGGPTLYVSVLCFSSMNPKVYCSHPLEP
jgi:hypothetical protein